MKELPDHIKKSSVIALFITLSFSSFGQGRVVINEFMAWSGCSTTSEFIELMNFGPGPMDIGCYIVTNGKYAVTIPPNTILQPGQYYLISGQNTLARNCGNRDSLVHVDLNWTTCNCADKPVPTTGDGFMENGGNANEKIVFLDPSLNVIDAASRQLPASSSVSITTSSVGGCTSRTFNLSSMSIQYETIGESTGIDNSYARKVDGDCGWVKTTDISAHAPNKTGSTASASYDFSAINTSQCDPNGGSISIQVSASNVSSLFPMSYTLAYDVDHNKTYNSSDQYTNGIDNSSPTIDINNMTYGAYRITVASSMGCNLKSFDFYVFNCYTVLLPLKLVSFNYKGIANGQHQFQFQLTGIDNLKSAVLEGSNGDLFTKISILDNSSLQENKPLTLPAPPHHFKNYRLRLTDKSGVVTYSNVISLAASSSGPSLNLWPNPVLSTINLSLESGSEQYSSYTIYNANNVLVGQGKVQLKKGNNLINLPAAHLPLGLYHFSISQPNQKQPLTVRFVKQ